MFRAFISIIVFVASMTAFAEGNAARGQTLTVTCGACHGPDGNSPVGAFPNIAGQSERYLVKQMHDIKGGDREIAVMAGILDNMTDQDILDIAAYYSGKESTRGAAKADLAELGESIYRSGIKRKNIAACSACHSPTGAGNNAAKFPALAGQWPDYTEAQLKAFRIGARHNDGESQMMRGTALDLSDAEISAVASYIYGLR